MVQESFFYLLDLTLLNGHALYKKVTGKKISALDFQENLIDQLIAEHVQTATSPRGGRPSSHDNPTRLSGRHFPSSIPETDKKKFPTKRCHVCAHTALEAKVRKETRYECTDCDVALCVDPCFKNYHTKSRF